MPLARWVPGLDSLLHYRRAWFRPDVQAGLSVAAIQIPTAIAYAQIAGFPPQVGLYACILPMLIYALIGSSRQLMVGPDAATAAMVAAAITPLAAGDPQRLVDLSMIVAIMVGLFSIVAGLARAGFIASFLSRPILVGYLNGIGLSLLVGQLGKLFGYEAATSGFVAGILALLENLLHIHWPTLILGSLSLLLIAAAAALPAALCGVLLASLAAALLGLDRYGVELLGEVPAGLPQLSWPQTSLEELKSLLRDATGITVVSFCSAMLTARSFAARHGYSINANHEFVALGLANIGAGVSQGFAISGADSRTAVNDMVGGKTQLVGVVAAGDRRHPVAAEQAPGLGADAGARCGPVAGRLGPDRRAGAEGLLEAQPLRVQPLPADHRRRAQRRRAAGNLRRRQHRRTAPALLHLSPERRGARLDARHRRPGRAGQVPAGHHSSRPGDLPLRRPLLFFNADYFKQRVLAVVDGSERPMRCCSTPKP